MDVHLPIPPQELNFIGGSDFEGAGQELLQYCIRYGKMQPHHHVLDVGCGIGRVARAMAGYLNSDGAYDGFDIVDVGIDWCRRNITTRLPNFRFHIADVHSGGYHPDGAFDAAEYVFPFPSNTFDFAFLGSVFTHMKPADVSNYLAEIARVLKVGGRCLITYFLQNAETRRLASEGKGQIKFAHRRDGYWIAFPDGADEDAICYDESDVLSMYSRSGFELEGPIHWGYWCGRDEFVTFQDFIIARKVREVQARQSPSAVSVAARRWSRRLRRWLHLDPRPHGVAFNAVQHARRHAG